AVRGAAIRTGGDVDRDGEVAGAVRLEIDGARIRIASEHTARSIRLECAVRNRPMKRRVLARGRDPAVTCRANIGGRLNVWRRQRRLQIDALIFTDCDGT